MCAKHSVSLLRPRSYATRLFWRHTWVNHPRMMKGPRSPKQDRWCVAGASRAACRTNDDGWSLCSVSAPLVARAARRDAVQHPSCVLAVGIGTHLLCFHRRRAARPANRHHVGLSGAGRGRAGEGRLPPLEGVEPPGQNHSFPETELCVSGTSGAAAAGRAASDCAAAQSWCLEARAGAGDDARARVLSHRQRRAAAPLSRGAHLAQVRLP